MNDSDFTVDEIRGVVGKGETLRAAYEQFAEHVARTVAKNRGLDGPHELPEDFFDEHPIPTAVEVIVQPHNQWVKAYWVKAY
jgi:hypothetical protein